MRTQLGKQFAKQRVTTEADENRQCRVADQVKDRERERRKPENRRFRQLPQAAHRNPRLIVVSRLAFDDDAFLPKADPTAEARQVAIAFGQGHDLADHAGVDQTEDARVGGNVGRRDAAQQAVKAAGKLGVEGKDYVVQDGDIMHFRFNV